MILKKKMATCRAMVQNTNKIESCTNKQLPQTPNPNMFTQILHDLKSLHDFV